MKANSILPAALLVIFGLSLNSCTTNEDELSNVEAKTTIEFTEDFSKPGDSIQATSTVTIETIVTPPPPPVPDTNEPIIIKPRRD
ncbi:MAG TPA: hypothetical protein VF581_07995 [Flavobacterium sp.]|jgi:hypothetical protein